MQIGVGDMWYVVLDSEGYWLTQTPCPLEIVDSFYDLFEAECALCACIERDNNG